MNNIKNNPSIINPLISIIPFLIGLISTLIELYVLKFEPTQWWIPIFPVVFCGIISIHGLHNDFKKYRNYKLKSQKFGDVIRR